MLNNKKNIIIAGLVVLILITTLILVFKKNWNNQRGAKVNLPAPEFLTTQEKIDFKLDDNVKAQVLSREASGTPAVYKLIKTDTDIIADPSKIGPISPRQPEPVK